jgi:hypothetical protein
MLGAVRAESTSADAAVVASCEETVRLEAAAADRSTASVRCAVRTGAIRVPIRVIPVRTVPVRVSIRAIPVPSLSLLDFVKVRVVCGSISDV